VSTTSERLRNETADVWESSFTHPFVQGIGRGDLDEDAFRRYLVQDYVFLIDYCRVLAFASARAPHLDAQTHFAGILQATLTTEMDLHRGVCAEWGITPELLEEAEATPTTSGYTSFLVRTAAAGDYGELVSALLPCMWGYAEIGLRLKEQGVPDHPRYAAWIETYADPEFVALGEWLCAHLDELGRGIDDATYRRWLTCFTTSARYENAFWEMAWTGESWR
jgi:thiaminase/transcriptional activator TenA